MSAPSPSPNPADAVIDALATVHTDLAERVRSLGPGDLVGPSGCAEWDVSKVLGHLGSAAELGLALLRATVAGTAPDVDNEAVWARWDAMTPEGRAAGFLDTGDALVAGYQGLDAGARASIRFDIAFLPEPTPLDVVVGFRLNEETVHSWDVAVAFDAAATLVPSAAAQMIDRTGFMMPYMGHADEVADRPVELAVETSGPERSFGLRVDDAVSTIDKAEGASSILRLPAEAWLRLIYGRLAPDHTPPEVVFESATLSLADLRRVFPGI